MELPLEPSIIDAKDEVMTTRFTVGAFFLMALRIPVVPIIAGSKRSFLVSLTLKWNSSVSAHLQMQKMSQRPRLLLTVLTGEAVWITASRPSIFTASSKAPSLAMSSTMRKSNLVFGVSG